MSFPPRPPPGWAPPFAGAPPPAPPGVNPNLWGAGAWHFNPAYVNSYPAQNPPPSNAGWAVGYGWNGPAYGQPGSHNQQQPSFNPYRRVPRPPSAEYMANALVENPLGLTNMIPRDQLYSQDGTPLTPWVWNPPGLIKEEEDEGMITAAFTDEHGRRISQEPRGPTPSRQSSVDRVDPPPPPPIPPIPITYQHQNSHRSPTPSRRSSYDRVNGSSIYANMPPLPDPPPSRHSDVSPNRATPSRRDSAPSRLNSHDRLIDAHTAIRRDSAPSRQNSQDRGPEPPSATQNPPTTRPSSTLPPLDRPLDRPKDPTSAYYRRFGSPGTPDIASPRHSPSRAGHTPDKYPVDESFTAKIDLQPTFSPNIVRIPDHYHSPTRRSSYDDESSRSASSSHPSSSSSSASANGSNPIIAQLNSRMDHLNITGTHSNHNQLARHSSLPSSIYGPPPSANHLSTGDHLEDPLSPLIYPNTMKSTRGVLRGFSVPDLRGTPLNTIPEATSSTASSNSTPAKTLLHHSPASSSPSTDDHHTPPPSASHHRLHRNNSQHYSNPLPHPPAETYIIPTRAPTPPSSKPPERVRVGFWNRRGDHLTRTDHIVYAPPDRAYPPELDHYPDRAYRDHLGIVQPYDPSRPELLESLPLHGRPASAPYDSFVEYV